MAPGWRPSASRPTPQRPRSTEAKRTAAGGRPRHRDTHDPRLGRHCADHAFLLMDTATRTLARLGANPSRIIRREGDSRFSLISNARGKGVAGFGTLLPLARRPAKLPLPPLPAVALF